MAMEMWPHVAHEEEEVRVTETNEEVIEMKEVAETEEEGAPREMEEEEVGPHVLETDEREAERGDTTDGA